MLERLFGRGTLKLNISVVIEPDEGGFHAYVPAFKGLHVDGKTQEEATRNVVKAVLVYLESLARHGDALPVGPDLKVHYEPGYRLPAEALLRSITVQWPSLQMSGIS